MATRLPAEQRKAAVLDSACGIFSSGSYRGTTTAQIARLAGVTEPVLYRHFASKRDLYLACVESAWQDLRQAWEEAVGELTDPREHVPAMARAAVLRHRDKAFLASLWIQALTEANDDAEIRAYLRGHVREVHDFVAGGIRRCQEAGAIPDDRDADAEAWMFLASGLLATVAERLGGVLTPGDVAAIQHERRRWLIPDLG